jgi:hypothetical protein
MNYDSAVVITRSDDVRFENAELIEMRKWRTETHPSRF